MNQIAYEFYNWNFRTNYHHPLYHHPSRLRCSELLQDLTAVFAKHCIVSSGSGGSRRWGYTSHCSCGTVMDGCVEATKRWEMTFIILYIILHIPLAFFGFFEVSRSLGHLLWHPSSLAKLTSWTIHSSSERFESWIIQTCWKRLMTISAQKIYGSMIPR